jgi:hypothetical protein
MTKYKRMAIKGVFIFMAVGISLAGIWNGVHPWAMLITIVSLMIIAFLATLFDDLIKPVTKNKKIEDESKNRVA